MTSAKTVSDLRVAIVGFGSIGHRHFGNLRAIGVENVSLVRRSTVANPAFTPPSGTAVFHDPAAAIQSGIDLAVICNPTSMHVPTARLFIDAGVPVLVEKPLAGNLDEALALCELAHRHNVAAGVAYCLRYHPAYAAARQAIHCGTIGGVLYAKAWFETYLPGWHPWEKYEASYAARTELGGGATLTLNHELDFLNWCLGRPESADCVEVNTGALAGDACDLAAVSIQYPDGVLASADLSLCRRDHSRGFEFVGRSASLRYRWDTGKLELLTGDGSEPEVLWHDAGYDVNRMYEEMLADFLHSLSAGQPPAIPLEAGVEALRAGGAATQHSVSHAGI